MLLGINNDPEANHKLVDEISGKAFNWYQRLASKNFGSSKYILKSIDSNIFEINLQEYNDVVRTNFDLRKNGIVFFFRFKQQEFAESCIYEKLTIQSSDKIFVIQTDKNLYKFEIINTKNHLSFIKNLFNFKNNKKLKS